jgi:hypothetical protein
MGGACSTCGRKKNAVVWLENLKGKDRSEGLNIDGIDN